LLKGGDGDAGRTLFDTPRYQAKPAQRQYAEKQHELKYGPAVGDQRGKQGQQASASRHGRWRRGPMLSSHGYVKVRVGIGHPLADPHGYAYEHLLVWVAAGNPRPASSVCLQWRNEDRTDNRIENLYLITRAERARRRNARAIRDPRGRVLSNAVARAVQRGAAVRYHYGGRRAEG